MIRISTPILLAALVVGCAGPTFADPAPEKPAAGAEQNAQEKPAAPAPAGDARDREIQELKQLIQQLQKRVEDLEKKPAPEMPPAQPPAPEPPAAATPAPADQAPPPAPTAPSGAGATFLPNISAVGNIQFRGGDTSRTGNRGQFNFDEFEVAFQDKVSPSLRYDIFFSAAKEEEWKLGMEEGFLTAERLATGLRARLGRIRIPFGKVNPTHPHQRIYIDTPAPIVAFLGPEGVVGDGANVEYLLPFKNVFAHVELGKWETTSETEDGLGFNGSGRGAWSGRLWLGREVGRDKELELGFSRYMGKGQIATGRGPGRDLAVNGVDLTYRSYPGSYQRILLQAEALLHETEDVPGSTRRRFGAYALGAYRWNQFWEAGGRADYTQYPFPIDGHEWAAHLFLTKYITEQTSLRLQLTHGQAPDVGGYNQILFQVLFGSGPHTHPLQ